MARSIGRPPRRQPASRRRISCCRSATWNTTSWAVRLSLPPEVRMVQSGPSAGASIHRCTNTSQPRRTMRTTTVLNVNPARYGGVGSWGQNDQIAGLTWIQTATKRGVLFCGSVAGSPIQDPKDPRASHVWYSNLFSPNVQPRHPITRRDHRPGLHRTLSVPVRVRSGGARDRGQRSKDRLRGRAGVVPQPRDRVWDSRRRPRMSSAVCAISQASTGMRSDTCCSPSPIARMTSQCSANSRRWCTSSGLRPDRLGGVEGLCRKSE